MEDLNLIKQVYSKNIRGLKYKRLKRQPVIICISGIPGAGKSKLAVEIEKRYKGIRIDNNWQRKHYISSRGGDSASYAADVDNFVREYLDYFFKKYNFSNKFFILDSSIDRKYDFVRRFSEINGFKLFLIKLVVSKEVAEQRAFKRAGGVDSWFVKNIDRWIRDFEEFNKKHKADFVFVNDEDGNFNLAKLFSKLDLLIN